MSDVVDFVRAHPQDSAWAPPCSRGTPPRMTQALKLEVHSGSCEHQSPNKIRLQGQAADNRSQHSAVPARPSCACSATVLSHNRSDLSARSPLKTNAVSAPCNRAQLGKSSIQRSCDVLQADRWLISTCLFQESHHRRPLSVLVALCQIKRARTESSLRAPVSTPLHK